MPQIVLNRPSADEYAEYYARYISKIPAAGDLVTIMIEQIASLNALLRPLDPVRAGYRYAPGKWTVREVLGHLIDVERVFGYRAASISRGDPAPLPSYDQDQWLPLGRYDERMMPDLLDEWEAARRANIALLRAMPVEALDRRGTASGVEMSARALIHIPVGHQNYHVDFLRDKYRAAFA